MNVNSITSVTHRIAYRMAMNNFISNYWPSYHPGVVILVDDEQHMLNMLKKTLKKSYQCMTFTSSDDAKSYIDSIDYSKYFDDIIQTDKNGISHINYQNLIAMRHTHARFQWPTVLCTDENMPGDSGLKLCAQTNDKPLGRIIFTGYPKKIMHLISAGDGCLDDFIVKESSNSINMLKETIPELQENFFTRHWQRSGLSYRQDDNHKGYMVTVGYMKLMLNFARYINAIEHYSMDAFGSRLFISSDGIASAIIIRNKESIAKTIQDIKQSNIKISDEELNALQAGKKILYTGVDDDSEISIKNLSDYLFDAEPIQLNIYDDVLVNQKNADMEYSNETLYFAPIVGKVPGIDNSKIASYDDYIAAVNR